MVDDHVKYKPSSEEWDELNNEYFEVWQGIPNYIIDDSFATRNGGKKYNKNHQWIEISKAALEAYKSNPNSVFLVQLEKDDNLDKKVVGIYPANMNLEDAISLMENANKKLANRKI